MVAMLSMTMAFAEGENLNSVNNVAAYDMSCNMNKLAEALSLTADQREAVDNIYQTFNAEMMFAAQNYNDDQRKEMVKKALEKNVAWMRYVLNDKQSHTYLMLLNTTMGASIFVLKTCISQFFLRILQAEWLLLNNKKQYEKSESYFDFCSGSRLRELWHYQHGAHHRAPADTDGERR